MSHENVEVVRRLFECTNARDFSGAMDTYADDVVLALHGDPGLAGSQGAVGKAAVGEWFGDWFRTFDRDYRFEIEEMRNLGERVLMVATHHGRGRASGTPFAYTGAWVYTVRDGRIVRCDVYGDRSAALAALRLPD